MKKNIKNISKKSIITLSLLALSATSLTGCGSKKEASAKEKKSGVTKLRVGSGINYFPYCYLDDDGNRAGYDYAFLEELDKLLDQYEFEYDSMSFDNILLSLDSDKIDLAVHEYVVTDERKEKYLFSGEYYSENITNIAVLSDNDSIKSIDDLAGKKVEAGGVTSNAYAILTKWNEEHDGEDIEVISTDSSTSEQTALNLKKGVWDAACLETHDIAKMNERFGDGKDFVKAAAQIDINNAYIIYNKDDTKIQQDIDKAIKQLKDNGTLDKLAKKWLESSDEKSE